MDDEIAMHHYRSMAVHAWRAASNAADLRVRLNVVREVVMQKHPDLLGWWDECTDDAMEDHQVIIAAPEAQ